MKPIILWGIFGGLQGNGERWIVGSLLSTSDVGRYGLAFTLISSSAIVSYTIFSQFLLPLIYEAFSSKEENGFRRGMKLVSLFRWVIAFMFLACAFLLGAIGDVIIRLVSTNDFTVGGWFLFLLTIGVGLFYMAQVEMTIGMSLRRSQVYLIPRIATSVASIVFYIIGCSFGGLIGTAVAVIVVNLGYLVSVIVINRRNVLRKFLTLEQGGMARMEEMEGR
jgi:O-antigen/teichoic acid export membrane protein